MRVKIIKSRSNNYWYASEIGKEFEVSSYDNRDCQTINQDYRVIREDNDGRYFIEKDDAIVVQNMKKIENFVGKSLVDYISHLKMLQSELTKEGFNNIIIKRIGIDNYLTGDRMSESEIIKSRISQLSQNGLLPNLVSKIAVIQIIDEVLNESKD